MARPQVRITGFFSPLQDSMKNRQTPGQGELAFEVKRRADNEMIRRIKAHEVLAYIP